MSVTQPARLSCPHCDHTQNFVYWQSINVKIDPSAKEDLLQRKLHTMECERCGTITPISYTTLYHDMEEGVMIWLCPDGEPPLKDKEEIMESLPPALLHRYQFRTVVNMNELIEKIRCFDDGLDDRVVELVKLLTFQQLIKQNPEMSEETQLYYSDTSREKTGYHLHFVIMRPGVQQSKTFAIPRSVYESIIVDFKKHLLDDSNWPHIDKHFAAQLFQLFHQSVK